MLVQEEGGVWGPPKGRANPGETAVACLARVRWKLQERLYKIILTRTTNEMHKKGKQTSVDIRISARIK